MLYHSCWDSVVYWLLGSVVFGCWEVLYHSCWKVLYISCWEVLYAVEVLMGSNHISILVVGKCCIWLLGSAHHN